jgi:hypothetical protein
MTSSRLLQQRVRMIPGHDFGWENDWDPVVVCESASRGYNLQFRASIWLAVQLLKACGYDTSVPRWLFWYDRPESS